MSDKKQLTLMSQFSIIRESPARILHNQQKSKQQQPKQQSASSELKFKIEPIGIQPEDDDDLETCPSRTRSAWPHQIIPWWKPADRFEKPPYSYATLIAHAILTSKDGRLTLSDIYKWISEAYPYYKRGQKGWQNSIRHNLSLNKKWFIKVDRRPTQAHPGKGGYWTLQMNMEKIFVDNLSQAGGHSRRHHDMGMYASLSTQYYRSESSSSLSNDDDRQDYVDEEITQMCPNIHITRPEDYQVTASTGKKPKPNGPSNVISAPRIRNMTTQEKSVAAAMSSNEPIEVITPPKTDPKNFIIRFNPMDDSVNNKRKLSRPAPKSGKKRNHVEPESSTAEEHGQGNGVGVDPYTDSPSKKRKSTTTTDTIITASPNAYTSSYPVVVQNSTTRPSDLIDSMPTADYGFNNNDFWMYDEDATAATTNAMLLTSEYPLLFDVDAQNILNGLTSAAPAASTTQHTDMKTINLQLNALENNIHYSNTFNSEEFSDPNSSLFISDLTSYHLEQYVDFGATGSVLLDNQKPPSDVLLEQDESMNTYWPSSNDACYMNYVSDSSSMPSC